MAIHPYVTFRGVQAHLDVQFTFSHGVAPSQCQIRVPPTPGIEQGGVLVLHFGGTEIAFPQCRVDRVDASRNGDGLMVWTLTILDRRWKWKECGQISGYYNVREGENTDAATGVPKQIKKGTEKSLRALMKLCLDAMGEANYNVSKVPDDVFPEVEWDYEIPANALAKLADSVRFRVVLNWRKDVVELWPDGEGQTLTKQNAMEYQITVDPPERPDQLIFSGARMLWEADLELEPIARDAKGNYWPLNDDHIPYRPNVTPIEGNYFWGMDCIDFCNSINDTPVSEVNGVKTYRDLAKADVYRKYRIKTPFKVDGIEIKDIERILPLLSTRLLTETISDGAKQIIKPKAACVWGVFTREESTPDSFKDITDPRSKLDNKGNPPKDLMIEDGFQVDERRGIVSFDRKRYQYGKKEEGVLVFTGDSSEPLRVEHWFFKPAKLWLRIAFGIRDEKDRSWQHKEFSRRSQVKKFGTKPRYIASPDAVFRTVIAKQGAINNRLEYERMANHYLDQAERQYEPRDPCAATYAGWQPLVPDGAIQQITWTLTEQGATTRVSRNREEPVLGNTYEEQRLYQQLRQKIADDPANSREANDKVSRRIA